MSQTLQPGETILGHYTVVGTIGQGGMGAVHKVLDTKLGIHRALKVIAPPKGASKSMVKHLQARFTVEARNLAQLRHPGVCTIVAFGELEDSETPYLLMEYLDGTDLMAWRSHNPSLERILEMGKQLASALAAIHAKAMIHRDIKLTNALVTDAHTDDEQLIVIDFGLAKTGEDPKLTQTGMLAGTSWYLAPEYVKASIESGGLERVEHTMLSDIWAMGCVLYALCAHRNVWSSPSLVTIHSEIVKGEFPPVQSIRTDISDVFAQVVMKCLSVDPATRYQSAKEVLAALAAVDVATDPQKPTFVPPEPEQYGVNGTRVVQSSEVEVGSSLLTSPGNPARKDLPQRPTAPSQKRSAPEAPHTEGSFEISFPSGTPSEARSVENVSSLFGASTPEMSFPDAAPPSAEGIVGAKESGASDAPPLGSVYDRLAPEAVDEANSLEPEADSQPEVSLFSAALATRQEPSRLTEPSAAEVSSPVLLPRPDDEPFSEPTPALMPSVKKAASPASYQPPENKLAGSIAAKKNFVLPALAAAGLCVVFAGIFFLGDDLMQSDANESLRTSGFVDPELIKERKAKEEVAKVKEERKGASAAGVLGLKMPVSTRTVVSQNVPIPQPQTADTIASQREEPSPAARRRRGRRSVGNAKPSAPAADATTNDPYAAYGRRAFDGSLAGQATAGGTKGTTPTTPTAAGTRIPVRLKGSITSAPPGPVIAIVTKTIALGGKTIPKGAEIHGRTAGAANNLIQVSFSFILSKGQKTSIRGRALAPDGRSGIPAKRVSGGASDIAAAASEAGLRAVGEGAASAVGDNPIGAAIRGGTAPAAGKARRIDHAQNVFQTRRNARFKVYVE